MSIVDLLRGRFGTEDEPPPPYACLSCRSRFMVQYQVCPECGGYMIERIDWDEQITCE